MALRKFYFFWFLICLCLQIGTVSAQTETPGKPADSLAKVQDSLRNNTLVSQSRQFEALEAVRITDSLRRLSLESELSALKSTDNLKKEALLKQLQEMKQRDSLRVALQKRKIDSLRVYVTGYPVVPFKDTLFFIYSSQGSFTPKDRAAAISERIRQLAGNYFFSADSLTIQNSEQSTDIIYRDQTLLSISLNDALWNNTNEAALASAYKTRIAAAIHLYKQQTSLQTLAKEIALAVLVLLILAAIIFYTQKLFRLTKARLIGQKGILIKGIRIRNYELFDVNRELRFFLILNNFLKWVIILLVIYFALPVLFSIFPWTEGFAGTLIGYFLTPVKHILRGLWNYLPNLFTILVIVTIFRYLLKAIAFFKNEIEKGNLRIPGFYPDWANPTFQIIKVLIYAFLLVVIFPYLPGSSSPVFRGVSVFLGVLFTFGSSGPLGNIVAGLAITYMRSFKIGDRVKIGEVTGDIIEKSLFVTRLRTIKNEIISIPNSSVLNGHTTNFSSDAAEHGLIIHTTVTIGYDAPWRQVHELLIKAAGATDMLLKDPSPFVLQTSLDDFFVSYQLNAYTREPNQQARIYSLLHQQIQDCFNEAGVEIMSPHYQAMRDGNQMAVPPENIPKDYVTPSFRVNQSEDPGQKKDISQK